MKQLGDKKIMRDEEHNWTEDLAKIHTKDMLSFIDLSCATHHPQLESHMKHRTNAQGAFIGLK